MFGFRIKIYVLEKTIMKHKKALTPIFTGKQVFGERPLQIEAESLNEMGSFALKERYALIFSFLITFLNVLSQFPHLYRAIVNWSLSPDLLGLPAICQVLTGFDRVLHSGHSVTSGLPKAFSSSSLRASPLLDIFAILSDN
jgi:hypothetical protein